MTLPLSTRYLSYHYISYVLAVKMASVVPLHFMKPNCVINLNLLPDSVLKNPFYDFLDTYTTIKITVVCVRDAVIATMTSYCCYAITVAAMTLAECRQSANCTRVTENVSTVQ